MEAWIRTVFLLALVGLSAVWTSGLKKKQLSILEQTYSNPRAPAIRSADLPCSYTGQECQTTSQCCNDQDDCVISVSGDQGTISTCNDESKNRKYTKSVPELKRSGQLCTTSSECLDNCCREIGGHTSRSKTCGPEKNEFVTHTCINATRTGNEC
ncbi:uncharacterized protein [Littorina saxatilis]|uniref:Uncharacterized protein n=1 Tax=Littorina saxatilis TaxID=31220 RepID=A0AAN9AUK7_9CAEN